ncbi:hypothetical protein SAMN04488498_12063 [Mesorhizobium albiziae]|uniref:Uncharacterized protein n=1 Tax=Neomesorhizobium albiziae TaxID=335020 RepID=A0A1I4DVK6_9HYPH|nr:hypothetical protein [Mesorhizobium albiziae]GLS32732.1 hypothetical protein GCM10007937_44420 [Mesorhizobium albiziae]SFK97708.1 hypothetical protein SAMN04488498_12063 [Mesorhizobium albiziae]
MRRFLIAAVVAVCGIAPALAGEVLVRKIHFERPSYDRTLEKAVMRIVARRIGDIRGPLATDMGPLLVALHTERVRAASEANPMTAPLRLAAITY